jgi:GrpB-like predicted nucleotidyltransferase (UPF0157 family)
VTRELFVVSAPDPKWAERAAVLIATLHGALGAGAQRIDHVGSTAIPAMDAKDVLDIQVSVTHLVDAQERFDAPSAIWALRELRMEPVTMYLWVEVTIRPSGPSASGHAGALARTPTFTCG